jgi:glutamate 5-kinase
MVDPVRQEVMTMAHTIVIKVGTNVLANDAGLLDRGRIASLAEQLHRIRQSGRRVLLVSSGAIGAGVGRLGLSQRPTDLRQLQACAAVGQSALMQLYQDCLEPFGIQAAQILLTAGDFESRSRYLNMRNTLLTLLEWQCLPIINENDTVSVAEIKFGDNDHLAAMVTNLLQAPLLILLSVVDGLYTADPRTDPTARLLTTVPHLDAHITALASPSRSALGTGGMPSKLRAARLATLAGECVVMANGTTPGILDAILRAEPVGTLFLPHGGIVPARKRWFGLTVQPQGRLIVDAGAVQAICQKSKSLLPVGVRRVCGSFGKGAVVSVCDEAEREIARGLCNYASAEAEKICGKQSEQLPAILGQVPYTELIHRDNLVVIA